ncbi:MAG: hypothetical protein HFJ34_03275 [Clostridia bacterium]|nr:hypothetical protein [Clostridia bacterium]
MKEKKEVIKNELKETVKNGEYSEKADLLEVGSTVFINPEEDNDLEDVENIKVEEIMKQIEQYQSDVVSDEEKMELKKAVKRADEMIKKTDGGKLTGKQKREEMEKKLQTTGLDKNVNSRETIQDEKELHSEKSKDR